MTGNKTPRPWKLQPIQSAKDRKWYLRLSGGNGEIVMASRGYVDVEAAVTLAENIRQATIDVLPADRTALEQNCNGHKNWCMAPIKSPKDGHWYNHLVHPTGAYAMWSEAYPRVDSARRACERTRDAMVVILPPHGLRR